MRFTTTGATGLVDPRAFVSCLRLGHSVGEPRHVRSRLGGGVIVSTCVQAREVRVGDCVLRSCTDPELPGLGALCKVLAIEA